MKKLIYDTQNYLSYLNKNCRLNVSVHFDYYNFKNLPQIEMLSKFNSHSNPYCIKIKGVDNNQEKCISFQKDVYKLCNKEDVLIKKCHGGVFQYIRAVKKENKVIGFVAICGYNKKIFKSEDEIPLLLCNAVVPPLIYMLENIFSVCNSNDNSEYNAVLQYLNEYHTTATLPDLCDHFMRSKSHISHLFKKRSGMTIKEYCNNLKLEDARKLLAETNFSVTEIAYDSGFNDVSYFISLFKEKYGTSPLKFRNKS